MKRKITYITKQKCRAGPTLFDNEEEEEENNKPTQHSLNDKWHDFYLCTYLFVFLYMAILWIKLNGKLPLQAMNYSRWSQFVH